jgi:hypothetical protein
MATNEFLHCVDCREADPIVLGLDQPIDDDSPCEVVCANCSRRRLARRWGALRVILGSAV